MKGKSSITATALKFSQNTLEFLFKDCDEFDKSPDISVYCSLKAVVTSLL
jgi:hypothetical protein